LDGVDALRRRVQAIREKVGRPDDPKVWHLSLPEGDEIPEHIAAQIGERDHVIIREYPRGYLGDDDLGDCLLTSRQDSWIVHRTTGERKKVVSDASRRRRSV
jgi:hypothetical protein